MYQQKISKKDRPSADKYVKSLKMLYVDMTIPQNSTVNDQTSLQNHRQSIQRVEIPYQEFMSSR